MIVTIRRLLAAPILKVSEIAVRHAIDLDRCDPAM
jgi:hypothetical protein